MSQAFVISFGIEAIKMAMLISAPMLTGALIIGLIISIIQAVTQIQEQTLTIVPKMAVILLIIIILFPWLLTQLNDYMVSVLTNIPRYINQP